jgi:hypothetical protein
MTFQDIEIVGIDENASTRSEGATSGLFNIELKLSCSAPSEWAQEFDRRWQQHMYLAKRRACASGSKISILCLPDELESTHIPELKKVIVETNKHYRTFVSGVQAAHEQRLTAESRDKTLLQDLNKRLSK